MKKHSRINGNILQVEYDFVLAQSAEECCFSLSKQEVAMLLSQTDYFGWRTRWHSESETDIDETVIRSLKDNLEYKLMSGCCPDEGNLHRFTAEGVYQTSTDNGVTWTNDPENDPRNNAIAAPPLPGSDSPEKQCASADNIRAQALAYRDSLIDILEGAPTLTAIIAAILAFIGVITGVSGAAIGISVLLIGLANLLLSLTPESVATQIDDTALDTFKCICKCNMQPDGSFTYQNWLDVLADIADQFSGFPETFFYQTVAAMGYIGLSNAGTMGTASASDCDDCDCGLQLEPFNTFTFANLVNLGNGRWRLISDDRADDTFTMYVQRVGGGNFYISLVDVISGSDSPQCVSSNAPGYETNTGVHCAPWIDSLDDCVSYIGYRALAPFVIEIEVMECP